MDESAEIQNARAIVESYAGDTGAMELDFSHAILIGEIAKALKNAYERGVNDTKAGF